MTSSQYDKAFKVIMILFWVVLASAFAWGFLFPNYDTQLNAACSDTRGEYYASEEVKEKGRKLCRELEKLRFEENVKRIERLMEHRRG